MVTFARPFDVVPDLYQAGSATATDGGWLGYLLGGAPTQLTSLSLVEAFGGYGGWFVFAAAAPFADEAGAAALVERIEAMFDGGRRCLWILDRVPIGPNTTASLATESFAFDAAAGQIRAGMRAELGVNLALEVVNGSSIELGGDAFVLTAGPGGTAPVKWVGAGAPNGSLIETASIDCAGASRGCLVLSQAIEGAALQDKLSWGFQTVMQDGAPRSGYLVGWYPLAVGAEVQIPMSIVVDPADPFNDVADDRTAFAFAGAGTSLVSGYRTSAGWPVLLSPVTAPAQGQEAARLWLHASPYDATSERDFVACPVGDFTLAAQVPPGATSPPELLCGLAGTETLAFETGDTLRFKPRQPGFAARYPYAPASPVSAPVEPLAPKLDAMFMTSWARLVTAAGGGGFYSAQPKGASLYAKPAAGDTRVLVFTQPGTLLAQPTLLPLLPYTLVAASPGYTYTTAQFEAVETDVAAAERRVKVAAAPTARASARVRSAPDHEPRPAPTTVELPAEPDDETRPATTPTGLIVQVDAKGGYAEIALAQDVDRSPSVTMKLVAPSTPVQEAFQTSQPLLVIANADELGTSTGWPVKPASGTAFLTP